MDSLSNWKLERSVSNTFVPTVPIYIHEILMYSGLKIRVLVLLNQGGTCIKILWMGERSRCCIKPCGFIG